MVVLVAAVLLIAVAFLLWGPIGLGNGPLVVEMNATEGGVDSNATTMGFILPIYNFGHSPAVIDAVDLIGTTRFRAPHLLKLGMVSNAACGGAWPTRAEGNGFAMEGCGGRYRGLLVGQGIPHGADIGPGFPAAAEVASPAPGSCWVLTEVVVHYHVGIRHYASSAPFELAVCAGDAGNQVNAAMAAAESAPG